jgi:hypothetical protein
MKNFISLLVLFLICVIVMPSCKKCETCSYSYTYTDSTGTHSDSWSGNVCGKKSDTQGLEDDCNAAAAKYGQTCQCTNE